jgi:hypothetical protein
MKRWRKRQNHASKAHTISTPLFSNEVEWSNWRTDFYNWFDFNSITTMTRFCCCLLFSRSMTSAVKNPKEESHAKLGVNDLRYSRLSRDTLLRLDDYTRVR